MIGEHYDLTCEMRTIRSVYDDLEDMLLHYDDGMDDMDKAHTWFRVQDYAEELQALFGLLKAKSNANGRFAIHAACQIRKDRTH